MDVMNVVAIGVMVANPLVALANICFSADKEGTFFGRISGKILFAGLAFAGTMSAYMSM